MAFSPKEWVTEADPLGPPANPETATKIDGAALTDLETRLSAYTDAQTAGKLAEANDLNDVADPGSSRANIRIPVLTPAACVATTNVALTGLLTIDGYTLVAGDLVLLTGQTAASQNGLWTAAAGAWARPTEFAHGLAVKARSVDVIQGTLGIGTRWLLKTNASITIDTNVQTWVNQTSPLVGLTTSVLTVLVFSGSAYPARPSSTLVPAGHAQYEGPSTSPPTDSLSGDLWLKTS